MSGAYFGSGAVASMQRAAQPTTTYAAKPSELWGVGRGPRSARKRSPAAVQRRRDKRAAKRANRSLKGYLRSKAAGK